MRYLLVITIVMIIVACKQSDQPFQSTRPFASDILGNPKYKAISYGGYRTNTREIQPSLREIIEDLKILQALDFKLIRTYNVHFDFAQNVLKAIKILKQQNPEFEMYVMLHGSIVKMLGLHNQITIRRISGQMHWKSAGQLN